VPPFRYFIPNAFTALSLLLGLGSIVMSVDGDFRIAAWMILWGVLLDKLDGTAARLFKATSKFGVEFDSFADLVVFGIAPAALVYFRLVATGSFVGWQRTAVMITAGIYALALAIRLARFNIMTGGETVFFGFPGTLMGAIVGSAYLTWDKLGLAPEILLYSPALLAAGALLMVSSLRVPKLKLGKNKAMNAVLVVNIVGAYVCTPLRLFPEYLFGMALLYTAGGVEVCLARPEAPTGQAPPEAGQGGGTSERLAA
jgi:CDP-diacylglycerol---serine O-phosphatidyltransferase